jgi:hypothetical protein
MDRTESYRLLLQCANLTLARLTSAIYRDVSCNMDDGLSYGTPSLGPLMITTAKKYKKIEKAIVAQKRVMLHIDGELSEIELRLSVHLFKKVGSTVVVSKVLALLVKNFPYLFDEHSEIEDLLVEMGYKVEGENVIGYQL